VSEEKAYELFYDNNHDGPYFGLKNAVDAAVRKVRGFHDSANRWIMVDVRERTADGVGGYKGVASAVVRRFNPVEENGWPTGEDGIAVITYDGRGSMVKTLVPLDVTTPSLEHVSARVHALESAIKEAVSCQLDDICWMDVFTKLAALVGHKFDPVMLGKPRMLRNCERFVDSLVEGRPYCADHGTMTLAEYSKALNLLGAYEGTLSERVYGLLNQLDYASKRNKWLKARAECLRSQILKSVGSLTAASEQLLAVAKDPEAVDAKD
jgi:hypothetical protein